jgi:hypothetical protein
MSTTAWLIETADPVGTTLYFCNDGDWCSNPNHAHRFPSAEQASVKLASMQVSQNFCVTEHQWCD